MKRSQILGSGLILFLVGFIIMVVRVVIQHQYGGLATFAAITMLAGVFLFFYYLLSSPKKAKK